jgi:hypothetical protein
MMPQPRDWYNVRVRLPSLSGYVIGALDVSESSIKYSLLPEIWIRTFTLANCLILEGYVDQRHLKNAHRAKGVTTVDFLQELQGYAHKLYINMRYFGDMRRPPPTLPTFIAPPRCSQDHDILLQDAFVCNSADTVVE